MSRQIHVADIDETIRILQDTDKSLVRFGDGEMLMISGRKIGFQSYDEKLSGELAGIITSRDEGLIVALPDIFNGLDKYVPSTAAFWKEHLFFYRKKYLQYCSSDYRYGSAFFSRCYMSMKDKSRSGEYFREIRKIWQGKRIVVVEGAMTHNGVGNDLFDECESVERIICPSSDAYARMDEIVELCEQHDKDKIFLVSLGPAAKSLVKRLYDSGFRALDIGQLDTEYDWFREGGSQKHPLAKHKLISRQDNAAAGYDAYLAQIMAVVE
ncbi:GT-D fold domain-containing glycosyltransferase [Butyrivibrio sp. MC2013]|uniref:GT-D fold domain-containing glycosyltransferase n=1 Tax=Butyrivibrio sp. MC2013 TaxID=1280686 RepID=UPI0018CB3CE6|nr:GT-D fold domain-containing glycosyltransferase [Butyrivibrio sp. MC2013]